MSIVNLCNNIQRYEYKLNNGESCIFEVEESGVIFIKIQGKNVNFEEIAEFLEEITKIVKEKGKKPKINIVKENYYLKRLARRCGYKKIPGKGITFDIWTHR